VSPDGTGTATGASTNLGALLAGATAAFGLVMSAALVAVVIAGSLQWLNIPSWLDNGIPLLVLAAGLVLAGRVATDAAGPLGPWCGLGAAILVAIVGSAVSRAGLAHGDGVEPFQIAIASATVLVLTGGGAWVVGRRRRRTRRT
jgi:hypothetical protein